jgi:hypothetical protein
MMNTRPTVVDVNDDGDDFSEFWTLADLVNEEFTLPDDIVPGFVSRNLNMIQGASGAGKSIIATELATAYATNTKFLGKFDVNVNPDRPYVCYIDQDTFDIKRVRDRFLKFECEVSRLCIPKMKFWVRLDDERSVAKLVRYLNEYRVGLLIMDSIHAFHKMRDRRNLEALRDSFREIIASGTATVLLSHITKGSSPSDKDAARGFGLIEATDYTHSVQPEGSEQMLITNVKTRYGPKGLPFCVKYVGETRPVEVLNPTLEDLILNHLLYVGDKGTTIVALRKAVVGDDHAISELVKTLPDVYADGKRGPGSHLWHVKHKPTSVPDKVVSTDNDSDSVDEPDDAGNQRTCLLDLDQDDNDSSFNDAEDGPNQRTSRLDFDDDSFDGDGKYSVAN